MQEHEQYSTSELLHSYLDGELETYREPSLFSTLASDIDLRAEMREYLVIRSAVYQDSNRLAPANDMKQNVLRAVGIGPTSPTVAATGATVGTFSTKAIIGLLSGLVVILALSTGFLAFNTLRDGAATNHTGMVTTNRETETIPDSQQTVSESGRNKNEVSTLQAQATQPPATSAQESHNNAIRSAQLATQRGGVGRNATPRSTEALVLQYTTDNRDSRIINTVIPNETIQNEDLLSALDNTPLNQGANGPLHLPEATPVGLLPATTASSALLIREQQLPNQSPTLAISATDFADAPYNRFVISLRGLNAQTFPITHVKPNTPPWYNNTAVGVAYQVNDNVAFGIETGNEAFSQIYNGLEGGIPVHYQQQPLLFWYGIAGQYTYGDIGAFGGLRPFGKAMVGNTRTGLIGKGVIGAEFMPDNRVQFSIGLEGSVLPYQFQNQWFLSQKLGITYGVALTF